MSDIEAIILKREQVQGEMFEVKWEMDKVCYVPMMLPHMKGVLYDGYNDTKFESLRKRYESKKRLYNYYTQQLHNRLDPQKA